MVITVIAVLAALLLPALQQARVSAIQVTCLNQLRQIGLSLLMYSDDYDGYPPGPKEYDMELYRGGYLVVPNSKTLWNLHLLHKPGSLMMCPSITRPSAGPAWLVTAAETEWSQTNYKPTVTTDSSSDAEADHGWGRASSMVARKSLDKFTPLSVLNGELYYKTNNGTHFNVTGGLYSYVQVNFNSTSSEQLIQHRPLSANLLMADNSARMKTFMPNIKIFDADFRCIDY